MDRTTNTVNVSSKILHTVEDFLVLRDKWQFLLSKSTQNNVFLSWEWHYTWWQCFSKPKDKLQILLIESNDTIVGIAPLYLQHTILTGKTLRFIGTGEPEADEVVTEYLDFIALSGHEQTVIDTVYACLLEHRTWQRVEFNYVLQNYLCHEVAEKLTENFSLKPQLIGKTFSTPLEDSETQYRETRLSSSRNKRLKRCLNALNKDGGGLVRILIENESEIDSHLSILQSLHDERWSAKNKSSIFESQQFMSFHRKLLTLLLPQNKANIALYYLNEKPLAALYVMYSSTDCHYYQSGFSKERENRYMPLFVSHITEMNAARTQGLTRYDFMRGSEVSYKSDFGCDGTDMFDLTVYRRRAELNLVTMVNNIRSTCVMLTKNMHSMLSDIRKKQTR